ncbi:MAG: flagellar biosynthesis protein FlhA [SAR116 cluster bacterium]|nr:flagellar biosynthesis protein FlhA [SAR116 cluster bacterium]
MEMTLRKLGINHLAPVIKNMGLPLGILMLVAMMVLPLPSVLLDVFFTSNILLSLLILMVAMNAFRPLDFSSFPTILLFATILRLGLNVASTRVVLSQGHTGTDAAGKVIEAFGAFVVAGNYVVGIFVFIILVIINLLVITKGAGRVSEVSARFTLDAMPGKQMAIDADLNAGALTTEEAKQRREEISKEADFYGSMDGASKFVKGDAIAGILILIINILGGLIIGIWLHGLGIEEAANTYFLLSVGDGLVAQIPSLLLAIATAIIVTRVSETQNLGEHISKQMNLSRAWLPVSGVLILIGIVPGMPNTLFLIAGFGAALASFFSRKSENREEAQELEKLTAPEETDSEEKINLADIADNSPISVQLGYGLIGMVDEESGGPLVNRITGIRRQVSKDLGFIIPAVRVKDDLTLPANQYRIRVGQTIVGEDTLYPDRKLAIPGDASKVKISGIEVIDPSFGMEAIWIESHKQAEAETNGYMVVEPESVLATHFSRILFRNAGKLIGQDDVQSLLDNLSESAPQLVQSVIPKIVPLHSLTGVMRLLLDERVPISDLRQVLETLSGMNLTSMSIHDMAEALRPDLAGLLIQRLAPLNEPLPVITFSSGLEHMLINMARQSGEEGLVLDNTLAQKLITSLVQANEKIGAEGKQAALVVSPAIRRQISSIVRQHIEDIVVMGFTELPDNRKINIIASIGEDIDKE